MNEELNKKYLNKIEEIDREYIEHGTELYHPCCIDKEMYHIIMDEMLIALLSELGYKEIVHKFQKARKDYFWYA